MAKETQRRCKVATDYLKREPHQASVRGKKDGGTEKFGFSYVLHMWSNMEKERFELRTSEWKHTRADLAGFLTVSPLLIDLA